MTDEQERAIDAIFANPDTVRLAVNPQPDERGSIRITVNNSIDYIVDPSGDVWTAMTMPYDATVHPF